MKRFLLICFIALIAAVTAGCAVQPEAEPTAAPTEAEPQPQLHTVAADTAVEEPEWTLIAVHLTLEDNQNYYAEGDDFLYFAIVGATEEEMELRFKLDEVTARMLSEQDPDNRYFITLDGERIGDAVLSDDCSVATIKGQHTYGEITALATKIRGLD